MGTSIKSVTAVRDAIDRLEWRVAIGTGFFGTIPIQAFAFHWDGRVVLHRPGVPGDEGRLSLGARWANRDRSQSFRVPDETIFEFATDLPGLSLDRIEALRSGGRLQASLEGRLFVIYREEHVKKSAAPRPWVDDTLNMLAGPGARVPCASVSSENFELHRDLWCNEVLARLRPPGRFILEVQVPLGHAHEEPGKRALAHLAEAQKMLDEGRDGEVARLSYRALDELRKVADRIEERYGAFGRDRIVAQIKETKSLCDPERHGDAPHHDDLKFDRPLAQHVLAMTMSIAGVLLR
jgi:hypothetical protein